MGLVVRFCLKHFRDINIFSVNDFITSYEIILNKISYEI